MGLTLFICGIKISKFLTDVNINKPVLSGPDTNLINYELLFYTVFSIFTVFPQISRSLTSIYIDSCGIYFIEITLKGCGGVSFEFQRNIYWLIYVISLVKVRFEACVKALIIFRVFNNQKSELKQVTSENMFLSSGTRLKIIM